MANGLLLVPVQLQVFVLNPDVCNQDGDNKRCAEACRHEQFRPMEQELEDGGPGYEAGSRRNRYGVYVHWILPQVYSAGLALSDSVPESRREHEHERLRRGLPPRDGNLKPGESSNTPEYLQAPTRWIVVRKLDLDSVDPPTAKPSFKEYQGSCSAGSSPLAGELFATVEQLLKLINMV
ncbi:hypothetical protein VTI74DRAFT_5190 [Chaetomium olivicolor]